ncbi:MAG: AmmeMemoRadiSam system radical SAM enzyme [Shewanella sp.]|nr:AmmeMemoRadiSam system radical SAM enzyme [Shewanella sp.]MCF1432159.1 AmmeMemoRadiSam system radical SAM enzyme [Shewanella sp.]MCF1439677.1 AmmeMemoRadiSam system radical SAM enzyme [Shewanella sp.]MCF1458310.1 AmmeMemoRadiSam system radical SAM enzyme [Shewanella sp.]
MTDYHPTLYWHSIDDGRVICDLCPRFCSLRAGKRGACFVRQEHNGEVVLTTYGRSSGFCIDPIEKKPLNHFYPGSSVLSFGTAGCNLGCHFCQNWSISKSRQMDTLSGLASPEQIAAAAQQHGCRSVAYTYNDPVIFLEYAIDTAKACRQLGISSVAVSAGYINPAPREQFFAHMDAANIDLKAFSDDFYHRRCGARLAPVLETLEYLTQETSVWLEITTLLIPGENDSDAELDAMTDWIADKLGPDVPLHFSAFHPDFKMMDKSRTPAATLLRAREIAQSKCLNYVYVGNVHHDTASSTFCPHCRQRVIARDWYQLGEYKVDDSGHCQHCGGTIAGRFAPFKQAFGRNRIPIKIAPS